MEVWALVVGAWGDSLACYGNICKYVKEHDLEKINVVYYGLHRDVVGFLKKQKFIDKVSVLALDEPVLTDRGLDPVGFFDFFQSIELLLKSFSGWMEATGLDKQIPDLLPTHIGDYYLTNPTECNRNFDVLLPDSETDWSHLKKTPYLLFQPYSIQSCPLHMHWKYWMEALDWTLNNVDLPIVLVGTRTSVYDPRFTFPDITHPKLINLVGKTSSLIDVLHIMANAEGVITTSNSLSMWSILTKKPALVVCHELIRTTYYYNWINYEPNKVLDTTASLEDFKQECTSWLTSLQRDQPISTP